MGLRRVPSNPGIRRARHLGSLPIGRPPATEASTSTSSKCAYPRAYPSGLLSPEPGIDARRASRRAPPVGHPPAELAVRLALRRTNTSPAVALQAGAVIAACSHRSSRGSEGSTLEEPFTPPARQFRPSWANRGALISPTNSGTSFSAPTSPVHVLQEGDCSSRNICPASPTRIEPSPLRRIHSEPVRRRQASACWSPRRRRPKVDAITTLQTASEEPSKQAKRWSLFSCRFRRHPAARVAVGGARPTSKEQDNDAATADSLERELTI